MGDTVSEPQISANCYKRKMARVSRATPLKRYWTNSDETNASSRRGATLFNRSNIAVTWWLAKYPSLSEAFEHFAHRTAADRMLLLSLPDV